MQDDLRTLLERARQGDRSALGAAIDAENTALAAWIRSAMDERLRGKLEADDVLQETLLRACERIERFTWRGDDSFGRWLRRIAKHIIWSASQKRSTHEVSLTIDPPRSGVSPSKNLRREERFERLERCLRQLSPVEGDVVRLARLEGLTAREIAARLERPEPTVKSTLARAL